jgi:putative hemolysin
MTGLLLEISLIFLLLLANGVFAMTEIAIVSSRRGLLQAMKENGNKGAGIALNLAENPDRFLSTVQIGITLVGIVAGAFGGASIAQRLETVLAPLPVVGAYAGGLSFVLVIGLITYFSLVFGELVPKRLAMRFPEPIASAMAGPMSWLAKCGKPFVSLLAFSTSGLLRVFGVRDSEEARMSREEFTVLLREGLVTGSTDRIESRMMEGVFKFETLDVYDIMIPRPKMVWIERDARHEDVWPKILRSTQEVFPIYSGDRDNLVGAVAMKDIYAHLAAGTTISFKNLMHPPLLVPETQLASTLLQEFRSSGRRAAFVLDEFGGVIGMVTLMDLMESIIGDVPSKEERLAQPIRQREDGSWLIDGLFEIEKLADYLEGFDTPEGAGDDYQTIAGWFAVRLERVPAEGDSITYGDWTLEIVDMDATRVDKVLATQAVVSDFDPEAAGISGS